MFYTGAGKKAEERALMGLGKVVNTGVLEVLDQDLVYAALTDMDFDWGDEARLVLKKGDEVVGEAVRDEGVIAELSKKKTGHRAKRETFQFLFIFAFWCFGGNPA
jgi:hypothetical protein